MNPLVVTGVSIYMIAMLGVGYYSSRKVKDLADYLVAGRRLPYGLAVATLVATWFGAGSCMGASGTVYSDGILGVVSDPFAAGLSLILAGLFYVGFLRRMKLLTVTDIFGIYYSKNSEIFASLLMIPVYIGWLGAQMVAIGYIMKVLLGIDPTTGVLIGSAIVLVYTYAGGMWAVTLTDLLQVVVLIIGLMVMVPVVLGQEAIGGLSGLLEKTPQEYLDFFPREAGYSDWVSYLGQWLLMGLGCIVGQDLIQRSLSSKNEKVAKNSAISAGVIYILMGFMPITIGLAGRLLMPGMEDSEMLMPEMAMKYLNPFMIILFMGASISAIMSSADRSLLAATSLATENVIFRIKSEIKEEDKLKWARYITVIIALFSLGVALFVNQIYALMVNSWATLWVGIFAPVTFALYWKKANNLAAWVSMISGTAVWLIYIFVGSGSFVEIDDNVMYSAATYGGVVSILSYVLVTLFRYKYINPIHLASEDPEIV
jgi:SSS family transporter